MLCRAAKDERCKHNCQTHLYRACIHRKSMEKQHFYVGIFKYMWMCLILIQIFFYDNFMVPFFVLFCFLLLYMIGRIFPFFPHIKKKKYRFGMRYR